MVSEAVSVKSTMQAIRSDFVANRGRTGVFGLITAVVWRLMQLKVRGVMPGRLLGFLASPVDVIWTKLLMGSDLPGAVKCGPGIVLPHGGRLLSINPKTLLGANVTLQQHVILGSTLGDSAAPEIADDVFIGPRATVLGGVRVGARTILGAHAVVVRDVPAESIAVGVPAKSKPRTAKAWVFAE